MTPEHARTIVASAHAAADSCLEGVDEACARMDPHERALFLDLLGHAVARRRLDVPQPVYGLVREVREALAERLAAFLLPPPSPEPRGADVDEDLVVGWGP